MHADCIADAGAGTGAIARYAAPQHAAFKIAPAVLIAALRKGELLLIMPSQILRMVGGRVLGSGHRGASRQNTGKRRLLNNVRHRGFTNHMLWAGRFHQDRGNGHAGAFDDWLAVARSRR